MANKKISELTAAATLDGTELVEGVQSGANVKMTAQSIANLGGGASYLKYVALLSQSGTDAPVATVLENTLGGTVVWTRDGVGNYIGTLTGAFAADKTICFSQVDYAGLYGGVIFGRQDADSVGMYVYSVAEIIANNGGETDLNGSGIQIEIRVYP